MLKPIAALLALSATPAFGQEVWVIMDGAEITTRLTGKTLNYAGASQTFYASGKTLYDAGRPSWGNWRVVDDQYCSQWPPGEAWDCYAMDRNAAGDTLRFIDAEGRPFVGRLVE